MHFLGPDAASIVGKEGKRNWNGLMFILAKGKKKVKIICPVTEIKKWKEMG